LKELRRDTAIGGLRHRLYIMLEAGGSTPSAYVFDQFMVMLIFFNVLAVILESVASIHRQFAAEFFVFDVVSVAIFTVEYLVRLWVSIEIPAVRQRGPVVGRLMFASRFSMIVDLFAFAPSYLSIFMLAGADLRVLRVFRLLRFLKLVRYSPAMVTLGRALYEERRALIGALVLMIGTAPQTSWAWAYPPSRRASASTIRKSTFWASHALPHAAQTRRGLEASSARTECNCAPTFMARTTT